MSFDLLLLLPPLSGVWLTWAFVVQAAVVKAAVIVVQAVVIGAAVVEAAVVHASVVVVKYLVVVATAGTLVVNLTLCHYSVRHMTSTKLICSAQSSQ